MEIVILLLALLIFGFFSFPLYLWFIFIGMYSLSIFETSFIFWFAYVLLAIIFINKDIRNKYISSFLVKLIKKKNLLPKISQSEKDALEAGTNWVESNFFKAKVNFDDIENEKITILSKEEISFIQNEVNTLCSMTTDWEIFQKRDLSKEVWQYLKDNKFFGMIIPKEYGGLGFSATAHSYVIEKLVSRSQVLAISVMVPNSLGPAELILKHGTKKQKDKYLHNLALGIDIPCFALTEANAGSDATSITSYGILFKDENDSSLKIKLNFEKRYITLANIATLIGLAFVLKDPNHLLEKQENLGITFALLNTKLKGIDNSRRHDPLGVPFVNSPLIGKDVIISIDDIIGEKKGIGRGWKMLVESLSIGRGISLPSVSLGGSKLALNVVSSYTALREQFGLSLNNFEAIEEKIAKIASFTYMLEASRNYTLDAIDNGYKPALVNSIMKYHTTEKFREIINDSMDVLGGSAIMKGQNNLLVNTYFALPICITVEGANILTRSLMQFGQGLIKSHPYIARQINALETNDTKAFDKAFFAHISLVVQAFCKSFVYFFTRGIFIGNLGNHDNFTNYKKKLIWLSASFTLLTNLLLVIFGASLKKKESLSGRCGDIISYSYLITSTLRQFDNNPIQEHKVLVDYFCHYAFNKIQIAFEEILNNITVLKIFVPLIRLNPFTLNTPDSLNKEIVKNLNKKEFLDSLTKGIFISKDKKDRLNMLQEALSLNQLYDTQFKMLKKEVKQNNLKKDLMPNILQEAFTKKLLNENEFIAMQKAYKLKQEIIKVDSFSLKAYKENR